MLTLSSGESSSCSRSQTKTEPAKGKINPMSMGIMNQSSLSCVPYGVSKHAALAQALITLGSETCLNNLRRPEQLA
jgi:hypothetical protein